MSIYDNRLWISDLDEMIGVLPELNRLAGQSVLITGCTGLIGSAVTDVLIRWNETHQDKIQILAAGRNEQKVTDRFYPYTERDWFIYVKYDAVSEENSFGFDCDYMIHGAGNSSPDRIVREPVETMLSNFSGTRGLLEYARKAGTKRLLYISSSEVYGKQREQKEKNKPLQLTDYGYIDILDPRNSYSAGKLAAETLCVSYYEEYGIDSVIVRPGHIYGPTAIPEDHHVASAWCYAVSRGEDIIMKSDGSQIRSYCYCLDCASAILTVLLKGDSAHAYNISNPDSVISIREMAEILTRYAKVGLKLETPDEGEKKGFNPMSNSSLDSRELIELGWKGLFDARRGFGHTVEILRSSDVKRITDGAD